MVVPKVTYMPLDQLVLTAEFRRLAPRPAQWVRLYMQEFIRTGIFDHNAATKVVYPSALPGRIRSTAHRLRHDPKVQAVVKLFLDAAEGNLAADLVEIQRCIDVANPKSVACQRLIVLKARLKQRIHSDAGSPAVQTPKPQSPAGQAPAPAQPDRFVVGEIVLQNGQQYRVTQIDDAGQILTAQEL
jgi:hypothetical protein